jgi:hypothetical protein
VSTEKDALQRRGEQKVFKEQLKEIKKTAASAALGQEVSVRAASAQIGLTRRSLLCSIAPTSARVSASTAPPVPPPNSNPRSRSWPAVVHRRCCDRSRASTSALRKVSSPGARERTDGPRFSQAGSVGR